MKIINLAKKYLPFIYIFFVISSFFYIRYILNKESITVGNRSDETQKEAEIKPVDVSLILEVNDKVQNVYKTRLNNNNTFDDLLENLYQKQNLFFEKTDYIYGTGYDLIKRQKAPDGYVWKVYKNDTDITFRTKNIYLKDNDVFKLVLSKQD